LANPEDLEAHQRLLSLRARGETPRGAACPPQDIWTELAAGLTATGQAAELLLHASTCEHCGALLRAESELLSSALSAEEEQTIAALGTAQPGGRRALARRMDRASRPRRALWGWMQPRWALAAALLVALAAWPLLRLMLPASPERLALAAYRDARSLELRFPGADYGPVKQQRAAGERRPIVLLEAEAAIRRRMDTRSPSVMLLDAKARIDLLEWQYESAIQELRRALALEPDSAVLLIDLASAHFERAEAESKAIDYGIAIEMLGKAMARNADAAALFNRAIVYERMGLVHQAIADWQQYLARYGREAWAAEARERLDALLKKKPTATTPSGAS